MKAIIPVAGKGTRLRPHTFVLPKVLLNVGGKPILSHILEEASAAGIDDFAFIVGYKGDDIKEYIDSKYDFKRTFYRQDKMLGLAYAVGLAEEYLDDEPVFIILGDTVFDVELEPIFAAGCNSLGVKTVDDPRRFGVAQLNEQGFIDKLVEKPKVPESNLALVGLYYIEKGSLLKEAIKEVIAREQKTKGEFQITDALQLMIDKGEKFTTFPVDGWFDCGKPETILATNKHLLSKLNGEYNIEGSLIRPPVHIDPTADIENSIIGPNTTISKGATVKNAILIDTIIGEDSRVADINLKDSIIGSNAMVSGALKSLNISDYSDITL